MNSTLKEKLINSLFEKVLLQAKQFYESDFKPNKDYTGNFELDKNKDSFGREFTAYIEKKTGIIGPINHRTLINILKTGLTIHAKNNTLNMFSVFCGYKDFTDFCENYSKTSIPLNEKYSKNRKIVFGILLAFLVIGGMISYRIYYKNQQKNLIIESIKRANKVQFEAFLRLPKIDNSDLDKYYIKNASAYRIIANLLKGNAAQKLVISNPVGNPSYYSIQKIYNVEVDGNEATAQTREHWYLRWFSLKENKYLKKYDVSNIQFYALQKEDGIWKVKTNDYEGDFEKLQ